MNFSSMVGAIVKWVNRVAHYAAIALLILMVGLIFLEVLFRYVFHIPFLGFEELARFCMVWIAFLIAGEAVPTNSHITIEVLPLIVRNKTAQRRINTALDGVALVLVVIFCYLATEYLLFSISTVERTSGLHIPFWIATSCVFVGSALMLLNYLVKMAKHVKETTRWE